jgi:phospholipase/carboxylesterase
MPDNTDALTDAITALVPSLLHALEGLAFISRHLHPAQLETVVAHVGQLDAGVKEGMSVFQAIDWPDDLSAFKERLESAATSTVRAYEELHNGSGDIMNSYKALRHNARALEALYPIAAVLPPVSRFFLEEPQREDAELMEALSGEQQQNQTTGIHHFGNEKKERGGFSLYIPENYDETKKYPVIVALHGGSGHGRDFLWSWVKTARSRGALLIAPTSVGPTWSLMGPDEDSPNLERILAHVDERWPIDRGKMLLTGMSDGGTFTYVQGLMEGSPFTHLAPVSASFHPFLLEVVDPARLAGLPIYLVHGAKDWMFSIDIARTAHQTLSGGGANVTYREIADLSHTYPRDENARMLDWFLDGKQPEDAAK